MRAYEALVILKAAGTEQDVARAAGQLEEQIKKLGGQMDRSEPWGRRRLAFRISRQQEEEEKHEQDGEEGALGQSCKHPQETIGPGELRPANPALDQEPDQPHRDVDAQEDDKIRCDGAPGEIEPEELLRLRAVFPPHYEAEEEPRPRGRLPDEPLEQPEKPHDRAQRHDADVERIHRT